MAAEGGAQFAALSLSPGDRSLDYRMAQYLDSSLALVMGDSGSAIILGLGLASRPATMAMAFWTNDFISGPAYGDGNEQQIEDQTLRSLGVAVVSSQALLQLRDYYSRPNCGCDVRGYQIEESGCFHTVLETLCPCRRRSAP